MDCAVGTSNNPNSDLIGKAWDGSNWDGLINKLTIWNVYMDQSQVEYYIGNEPDNNNDLIAYYKFNSGNGDILYDHSGNANHGAFNGSAWAVMLLFLLFMDVQTFMLITIILMPFLMMAAAQAILITETIHSALMGRMTM